MLIWLGNEHYTYVNLLIYGAVVMTDVKMIAAKTGEIIWLIVGLIVGEPSGVI